MEKLEERKHAADLFAFFLFDDRPSHIAVERFADEEFDWLDELAASAQMFFFIFLRRDRYRGGVYNPGLEVARMFGIRPNQLPGVVLFTLSDNEEIVTDGVFLPIKVQLFADDISSVEKVFSDLFTLIHECHERSSNPKELLQNLSDEFARLRTKERLRPIVGYLKETALAIVDFPRNFMGALERALAEEVSRRLTGG